MLLSYSEKQDREKFLGMFRGMQGIAMTVWPYVSAGLYSWAGTLTVFMVVGVLTFCILPFVYWYMFKARAAFRDMEYLPAAEEETERLISAREGETAADSEQVETKQGTFRDFLQTKFFCFALGTTFLVNFALYYQLTLLNKMFLELYDIEPQKSNLMWLISSVTFVLFSPLPAFLLKRKILPRRQIMYFGLFALGIGLFMRSGDVVGEPSLAVSCISFVILPMGLAPLIVTVIPEQLDAIERTDDYKYYEPSDVQLAIVGVAVQTMSLAQGFAGLFGNMIAGWIGYAWALASLGIMCWVYMIIYYWVCGYSKFDDQNPTSSEKEETTEPKRDDE